MTAHTKLITDYIDDYLSDKESTDFLLQIKKDKSLNNDFVLIQDINLMMKGKLISEKIESDINYPEIEKAAKEDILYFSETGKTDKEILNYLAIAFPGKSESVKNQITEAEQNAKHTGINDLTEEWVNEFYLNKELNSTEKTINPENRNREKHINMFLKKNIAYIAIAASFALLLLINNIFERKSKNERIFSEFHQQPEKLTGIQIRNADFNTSISFENAVKLFNSGNYKESYEKFHQTAIKNKNFVQASYYSGLALFEAEKYTEAVNVFTQILNDFDIYHFETEWYLSMAYIKLNKMQKAVPYLKDIASQKNLRQKDAEEILTEIGN